MEDLNKTILDDIDAFAVKEFDKGFREHLGASDIGNECNLYLWLKFRWCFRKEFPGRSHRLFQRGHDEEARFIRLLRGIGCVVQETAPNGKQIRFSAVGGHFGGSCDGVVWLPERYMIECPLLLECKTHNTGSHFVALKNKGVKWQIEGHFSQMCVYGVGFNLKKALYVSVNKNDDDLHAEVLDLDERHGQNLIRKAERIITSDKPFSKLSDDSTYFKCKWCDAYEFCHNNKPILKNCRSCSYASPVDDAQWYCGKNNGIIPSEFILKGCDEHNPIFKNV